MLSLASIHIRLVSAFALVGVIMTSTVVAWAMPCGDECASLMAAAQDHDCCAPTEPSEDTRITTPVCCGGDVAMACMGALTFERDDTSAAHERSRDVVGERWPQADRHNDLQNPRHDALERTSLSQARGSSGSPGHGLAGRHRHGSVLPSRQSIATQTIILLL